MKTKGQCVWGGGGEKGKGGKVQAASLQLLHQYGCVRSTHVMTEYLAPPFQPSSCQTQPPPPPPPRHAHLPPQAHTLVKHLKVAPDVCLC